MQNSKTCTHIKVTGVRCGSPSLRGEQFCYFHQRMHRGVRTPPQARLHPIALIEDEESIQASLMEVINALMRNTIDLKRATLILRALHIAVKNAQRVKFNAGRDLVREVPEYAGQTAPLSEQAAIHEAMNIPRYDPAGPTPPRIRTSAELVAERNLHRPTDAEAAQQKSEIMAHYFGYPNAEAYAAAKKHAETTTAHVGIAAQARPEQAQRVERGSATRPAAPVRSEVASAQPTSPGKKLPASVNKTAAPQERKSAAHRG